MVKLLGGPGFNLQCHHQLLTSRVSLGMPLHFSEPHFAHLRDGCDSSYFSGILRIAEIL